MSLASTIAYSTLLVTAIVVAAATITAIIQLAINRWRSR